MIRWKTVEAKYGPDPHLGYVGKIHSFTVSYGSTTRGDKTPYRLSSLLPGFKAIAAEGWRFATVDEGKAKADDLLKAWLTASGLSKTVQNPCSHDTTGDPGQQ
jgi:hypothetical protein